MADAAHVILYGGTGKGKTYLANQMHRRFPGVSIFCDGANVPYLWGTRISSPSELARAIHAGDKKIVVRMPRESPEGRKKMLREIRQRLEHWGKNHPHIWCQIIVDEAHKFNGTKKEVNEVEILAREGRNFGIRLVAITQYPTGLDPEVRSQVNDVVIFEMGSEGSEFFHNKTYPAFTETAMPHIAKEYHCVMYKSKRGPILYTPSEFL